MINIVTACNHWLSCTRLCGRKVARYQPNRCDNKSAPSPLPITRWIPSTGGKGRFDEFSRTVRPVAAVMLELDGGCTPPKWKRPEDVMKAHRMKMKKRALQSRFVKSMDSSSSTSATAVGPAAQRSPAKNPFR